MKVERKPKDRFEHIFAEEIHESIDAIQAACDFGNKFISNHQVVLGGFENSKEELNLIQNLIIASNGCSFVAAQYGAFLMKHLEIFNSVKVLEGYQVRKKDMERIKYAGYLTLSQSGNSKSLTKGVQLACELGITCINVINVEDSPVSRVVSDMADDVFDNESIGMYMKSGFCYSDVKSFLPQVISLALVSIWFSDLKALKTNNEIRQKRAQLIKDIEKLPGQLQFVLGENSALLEKVAERLRDQKNLFILGKGAGHIVGNYIA